MGRKDKTVFNRMSRRGREKSDKEWSEQKEKPKRGMKSVLVAVEVE